jgi:hypothetical protein
MVRRETITGYGERCSYGMFGDISHHRYKLGRDVQHIPTPTLRQNYTPLKKFSSVDVFICH